MKKITIFILLSFLIVSPAFADSAPLNTNHQDFEYVFHLYYDSGKLVTDRDFQFNYDIIVDEYVQSALNTQFPYRGDVINLSGEVANHFVFDPKNGDTKFVKGKISVKAPYVADAQKVIFYDNQNQPILTIPVSASSFCNDDGICNADRGEDSLTCPKDCKQASLTPPTPTPTTTSTGSSGSLFSAIAYLVIGIILAGLIWWFLRRRGNPQTFSPRPPSVPLTPPTLPTPPTPPSSNNPV